MASIVIAGNVGPEVKEMVEKLINGKISFSRFFKFLSDNGLESKVTYKKESVKPAGFNEFAGDILSTILNIPGEDEEETECEGDCKDCPNNSFHNENEDDGLEDPEEKLNKTDEEFKKNVKDTVEYAKRLIDDYGDFEDDDIEHTRAVKLFHSMMILGRTYRKRANKGDNRYDIPNFTPENILKFIDSIGLPTDKIKASLERGKSTYYKMKIYKDFDDFVSTMKDIYGIEDVWNPPKEVPEWFEYVRNMQYRKFYPTEDIIIDESEWNEFQKWKKESINEASKKIKSSKRKSSVDHSDSVVKETTSKTTTTKPATTKTSSKKKSTSKDSDKIKK